MKRKLPLAEHLASRSVADGDCLVWQGTRNAKTYGRILVNGKIRGVHAVAYELAHGPVPKGMVVRHACDNPPCLKLEHLLVGTQRDNMLDRQYPARDRNESSENYPTREMFSFYCDIDIMEYLRDRRRRTGESIADQVRRVLRAWMEREQGIERQRIAESSPGTTRRAS